MIQMNYRINEPVSKLKDHQNHGLQNKKINEKTTSMISISQWCYCYNFTKCLFPQIQLSINSKPIVMDNGKAEVSKTV